MMKQDDSIDILIVEDDPIIAEDLSSLLHLHNYNVVDIAHSATDAIDALLTKKPNFVILDIHLGSGQTGIDVAEIINSKYHIPFIFLTSFDDEATLDAAQEHSPFGYLVKPFQDRTLLTTLKIALTNYEKSQTKELTLKIVEEQINQVVTTQEFNIIKDLIKGLSYKQIAEKISLVLIL